MGAPLLLPAQTFYFCDTTTVDGRPGTMRLGFFDLDSCSARFSRFTYSTTANDIGIFYDVPTGGLVQFYGFAFNPITENVMDYIGYGVNTIGPEAFQRNSEINTDTIQAFTCGGIHDDVFHTPYYYAAGKGLFAVNERRGEGVTFLGNFPEGMEAAGDLTVRSNRLFMTTKSHTLVEVDVDNPANSEVVMHFPDSIPLIHGLATFPNDCRNVRTYAVATGPGKTSVIYEIDFDRLELIKVCETDLYILGAATGTEKFARDCVLSIDLDFDDDTMLDFYPQTPNHYYGALYEFYKNYPQIRHDFQSDVACEGTFPICDEDVQVRSEAPIEAIYLSFANPAPDGNLEFLKLDSAPGLEVTGSGSRWLTLRNSGGAGPADFEAALRNVRYHNVAEQPTLGRRVIQVKPYAGGQVGPVAEAHIQLNMKDLNLSVQLSPVSCRGGDNGVLILDIRDGLFPITVEWDHGPVGQRVEGVSAGLYQYTLIDSTGCRLVRQVRMYEPAAPLEIRVEAEKDSLCAEDGRLTAVIKGGEGPFYQVRWNTMEAPVSLREEDSITHTIDSLPPGLYSLNVKDGYGCTASIDYTLHAADTLRELRREQLCAGEAFSWNGTLFYRDTSLCQYYQTASGCDSLFCLELAFLDTVLVNETRRICPGDVTEWEGLQLSADTTICRTALLSNGCDSTYCLRVEVYRPVTRLQAAVCTGDGYPFAGELLREAGLYRETLTAANGCDSIVELELSLYPLPAARILGDPVICSGVPTTLISDPFAAYAWSNGGAGRQTAAGQPGLYALTVTDENGCRASDSLRVEAVDLQYEIEATDPVCAAGADGRVVVRNVRGGFPPYLYSLDGGGLQSEPAFDGLTAGRYRLRVEESLGCSLEKEAVLVDPPPFGITLGEDRRMYLGDTIRLAVKSTEAVVLFQWLPPDGLSCEACPEPLAAPRAPVRYTVSAVSALGCEAEAGVFVDVMLKSLAYAPNAFSPNGDGRNDYFTLYGAADWVQLHSLRIYDRWGALVFERLEPTLGSETDGWDGTFQGRTLPAGVYVYFAELSGPAGETEVMSGEVVLLR